MNSKLWIQKALTMCSLIALVATYSMVTLASSGKVAGELVVSGTNETSFVTVNGEPAKSGRTVFFASTITTPEGVTAVLNMGKAGRVQISPNTTFSIDGDSSGSLSAGTITLLSSTQGFGVKTLAGETVTLNAGETVSANATSSSKQTGSNGGTHWAIPTFALIFIGLTGYLIYQSNNDDDGVAASPVR